MSQVQIKQINGLEQRLIDVNKTIRTTITQINHNFIVGRVISFYNSSWVYADANDENKLGRAVIEQIIDSNTFTILLGGVITVNTWNLTPSAYYFVDGTGNGTISTNGDSTNYNNPILQAITTTTAHVVSWRPSENIIAVPELGLTQEYTQEETPTTTNGNYSSTGITLDFKPINDSTIQVYVNGNAIRESYGTRDGECYFSSDNGTTAKSTSTIDTGDTLYWNGIITGYNLDNIDHVSIVYHKNILDV